MPTYLYKQLTHVVEPAGESWQYVDYYFIDDSPTVDEYIQKVLDDFAEEYGDVERSQYDLLYWPDFAGKRIRAYDGESTKMNFLDDIELCGEITEEQIDLLRKFGILNKYSY